MAINIEYLAEACENLTKPTAPLLGCRVRARLPNAADDFMDRPLDLNLDLNEFYVPHPNATYFV